MTVGCRHHNEVSHGGKKTFAIRERETTPRGKTDTVTMKTLKIPMQHRQRKDVTRRREVWTREVTSRFETISITDLKVQEDSAGNVLSGTSLREKGVESIVTTTDGLVRRHLTVRLDAMLQTVQLPAGIANLDTGLTDVNGDDLTHGDLVDGNAKKRRRGQQQDKRRTRTRFPASCEVSKVAPGF